MAEDDFANLLESAMRLPATIPDNCRAWIECCKFKAALKFLRCLSVHNILKVVDHDKNERGTSLGNCADGGNPSRAFRRTIDKNEVVALQGQVIEHTFYRFRHILQ